MPILLLLIGGALVLAAILTQTFVVPLTVLGAAFAMMAVERMRPGRNWPDVKGWWARVFWLNAIQAVVVVVSGYLWDRWMLSHQPWNLGFLGPVKGGVLGYLAITFVFYWWHRWRHQFDFLWRTLHQVHHSPQRIEVITSFYKHPYELVSNGLIVSAVLYLGLGLSVEAATNALLLSGLAELFYHWNVPTPYCLGYIIQRPESHCVHHQDGHHRSNYGDLPLWDMLFGTFDNPRKFDAKCGFGDREHELTEMLLCHDVFASKPKKGGVRQ